MWIFLVLPVHILKWFEFENQLKTNNFPTCLFPPTPLRPVDKGWDQISALSGGPRCLPKDLRRQDIIKFKIESKRYLLHCNCPFLSLLQHTSDIQGWHKTNVIISSFYSCLNVFTWESDLPQSPSTFVCNHQYSRVELTAFVGQLRTLYYFPWVKMY